MREELEKSLKERYPSFFRDLYGDPMKTCMAWGCTCGDGWYNLIESTCAQIAEELKKTPELDFKFTQVKEKFGGLRLYFSGGNEAIYAICDKAENDSYNICENCGTTENVETEGSWIQSLCKECRK